jgi:predicted PurR-regulated permease PerM
MFIGVVLWGVWGLIAGRIAASFVGAVLSLILYFNATRTNTEQRA